MKTPDAVRSAPVGLDWKLLAGVAAVSVLTMPLTAIWFLLAGFVTLVGPAIAAVLGPLRSSQVLRVGASVGLGLLTGPTIYLGLAALA